MCNIVALVNLESLFIIVKGREGDTEVEAPQLAGKVAAVVVGLKVEGVSQPQVDDL